MYKGIYWWFARPTGLDRARRSTIAVIAVRRGGIHIEYLYPQGQIGCLRVESLTWVRGR